MWTSWQIEWMVVNLTMCESLKIRITMPQSYDFGLLIYPAWSWIELRLVTLEPRPLDLNGTKWQTLHGVHRVLAYTGFIGSLRSPWKSLNFEKKIQALESPWKVLEFECFIFWNFCQSLTLLLSTTDCYCFTMDYKWFDVNNLLLPLVQHWWVHWLKYIYLTLNFDVAWVWYVFLSILWYLKTAILGPWKSFKSPWILSFQFAMNPVYISGH